MTLVLSYLTPDFVVQVSDRRLTWSNGSVADDSSNKATVYCGRMAFAYTGLAQIKTHKTDEWLTMLLARAKSMPEAMKMLKDEATAHFRGISETPRQRRHAFVAVGWTRRAVEEPFRRILVRVSNFHDATGGELAEGGSEFSSALWILEPNEPPRLNVTGRQLTEDEALLLGDGLRHMQDATDVAFALARMVRIVAARDAAVGRGILAVHIPRAAVEAMGPEFEVLFGAPFGPRTAGSAYFPANSQEMVQYGPNVACYGVGMTQTKAGH